MTCSFTVFVSMLHCVTPNIRELPKFEILIERVKEVAKYFERIYRFSRSRGDPVLQSRAKGRPAREGKRQERGAARAVGNSLCNPAEDCLFVVRKHICTNSPGVTRRAGTGTIPNQGS